VLSYFDDSDILVARAVEEERLCSAYRDLLAVSKVEGIIAPTYHAPADY
jgi:hypothetical protein